MIGAKSHFPKHVPFARYMERDAASRVIRIFGGDDVEIQLYHDGPGRLLARLSPTANYNSPVSFVSVGDVYQRDDLGRVTVSTSFMGPLSSASPLTQVSRTEDSLGRVHREAFGYAGMSNTVEIDSTWSGGEPFRVGLSYNYGAGGGTGGVLNLAMTYASDAVGRMASIGWNGAGSEANLATYSYQGAETSQKVLTYSAGITGITDFAFDAYGHQSKIETKQGSTTIGKVEFFFDAASVRLPESPAVLG